MGISYTYWRIHVQVDSILITIFMERNDITSPSIKNVDEVVGIPTLLPKNRGRPPFCNWSDALQIA